MFTLLMMGCLTRCECPHCFSQTFQRFKSLHATSLFVCFSFARSMTFLDHHVRVPLFFFLLLFLIHFISFLLSSSIYTSSSSFPFFLTFYLFPCIFPLIISLLASLQFSMFFTTFHSLLFPVPFFSLSHHLYTHDPFHPSVVHPHTTILVCLIRCLFLVHSLSPNIFFQTYRIEIFGT